MATEFVRVPGAVSRGVQIIHLAREHSPSTLCWASRIEKPALPGLPSRVCMNCERKSQKILERERT